MHPLLGYAVVLYNFSTWQYDFVSTVYTTSDTAESFAYRYCREHKLPADAVTVVAVHKRG